MAGNHLGLIIKIETRKGFKNLPRILLGAMRSYPVAVMIARGDLAVEAGWERLAELQEEILWLCEAARVPVIWATQVLEHTAKKGQPSRAEISDAALSQRADCVTQQCRHILTQRSGSRRASLRRMQGHVQSPQMRKLRFSDCHRYPRPVADAANYPILHCPYRRDVTRVQLIGLSGQRESRLSEAHVMPLKSLCRAKERVQHHR